MQGMLVAILMLAGTEPSAPAEDAVSTATATIANQHVAINVLAALHYCEYRRWPEDIAAVQAFHRRSELPLPIEPDWRLFGADAPRYTLEQEVLTVTTPAGATAAAHRIVSTNRPPDCADRNIKVNTAMHIGE